MYDFSKISVAADENGRLVIENPTSYQLIGNGRHGAIFKISEDKCVKIYVNEEYAKKESAVYIKAVDTPVLPRIYEFGQRCLVMEFIKGLSLKEYIEKYGDICEELAKQLIFLFREIERIGFKRRDESLRHILVQQSLQVKIIDNFYAFTQQDDKPVKFFRQMDSMGVLFGFLELVKTLDVQLYNTWKAMLPEYF